MFASIVWPKGRPPTDKPDCGFNNELCEWLTNGKEALYNWRYDLSRAQRPDDFSCRCDPDITLLTLLVAFPLIGVLAVSCIGILVWQKLGLQSRLDDSYWWLINYSDITIIRESPV